MMCLSKILKSKYGLNPSEEALEKLEKWHKLFLEYNSHTNLVSKNDSKILIEKHVTDSLALYLFEGFKSAKTLLDVGCGGGFPSVILAIFFPDVKVYALDSIGKKIKFIEHIKAELGLDNLIPIYARCEDIEPIGADIVTSRAVGKISDVWQVSRKHLKDGGYFVSYKALGAKEEGEIAENKFKELTCLQFISYALPLDENFTRELVIFKKLPGLP